MLHSVMSVGNCCAYCFSGPQWRVLVRCGGLVVYHTSIFVITPTAMKPSSVNKRCIAKECATTNI